MAKSSVRYVVNDVDTAVSFYTKHLDFHLDMHPDPTFAILSRGVERLRRAGVALRSDVIVGVGGNQVLLDDPSGNPVELFEYKK